MYFNLYTTPNPPHVLTEYETEMHMLRQATIKLSVTWKLYLPPNTDIVIFYVF